MTRVLIPALAAVGIGYLAATYPAIVIRVSAAIALLYLAAFVWRWTETGHL